MSMTRLFEAPDDFQLSERYIYGSSRIGMNVSTHVFGSDPYTALTETTRELGRKQYEISNHLGNVLSVITDQKLPVVVDSLIVSYSAVVVTATDYSPFGVGLYGRSWSGEYRYGFNGKEVDSEGMGGGSSTYDYGFRIYNAQLGKFLSVDPLTPSFPWYTPYQFAGNMPMNSIDLDGLEQRTIIVYWETFEDCSAQFVVHTKDLPIPGPLGLGIALIAINENENKLHLQYTPPVEVNEVAKESYWSSFLNGVDNFFDPKGGFYYSSEVGCNPQARYGNGDEIKDMDMVIQALSGMHAAASLAGNPLLSSELDAAKLDAAFDFMIGRIQNEIETVQAIANEVKTDVRETKITVYPAGSTTQTKMHLSISQDSLEKLKQGEGITTQDGTTIYKSFESVPDDNE